MYLRKKLSVAVILLLVCAILLISASYAWFAISRVPEISHAGTNIGANGSLEIALLNDTTYTDPTQIRAKVGDSAAIQETTISNLSWGNVVDLSSETYGLNQISLLPARLNVSPAEENKYYVNSNILIFPDFGLDGRSSDFYSNTVSAIYRDGQFNYFTTNQSYGVRGIGSTSEAMTPQQSALARARTLVLSYKSATISTTKSAWTTNGASLLDISYQARVLGKTWFNDSDVAVLCDTATRMIDALSYMDCALRQGIVGYAAANIENQDDFQTLRSTVENTSIPLSLIIKSSPVNLTSFSKWVTIVENDMLNMQAVITACNQLSGNSYAWSQISPLLNLILNENYTYLGSSKLSALNSSSVLLEDNILTVNSNAGVMADVADFCGDYNVFFSYSDGASVEVVTVSTIAKPYLSQISNTLDNSNAAFGDNTLSSAPLDDIYGYAIDLALRCNEESDLLLQTTSTQRIDVTSNEEQTQGGGSYMSFTSQQLSNEQIVRMMDAIRIAFVDNQSTLLAVAKLDADNCVQTDTGVTAPLYLHEYTVSIDGIITIGNRLADKSRITSLPNDAAIIMTAIVWLDGDQVDNSLASITEKSIDGALNLQFATNAKLLVSDYELTS